ncbi:MAG: YtxH domain-containing protein [Bacilli bacterium]|nr:YtxH domain-containing protein [Bacilli bacterium]
MSKKGGLGKFALGAGIGAALGLLFAPKKGEDFRADLKVKFDDLVSKVRSMDVDEVRMNVEDKIEELRLGLENLDKETVLAEAKKQATKLKKQANDLLEYAIEKGTPVIEKSANNVKNKVIEVSQSVIDRLSEETPKAKKTSKK